MLFRKSKPKGPLYQHYANINPASCEACLHRHGELFSDPEDAPPNHEGCRCGYLPVAPDDIKEAEARAARMREKAGNELRRRALFERALRLMEDDLEEALHCLRASVAIDIYIEEVEELRARYAYLFDDDPELTGALRKLFTGAHFEKMDQPKYELIPSGLYAQLDAQGRQRIQALFADPVGE